jgi:predicted transcriptional regulator
MQDALLEFLSNKYKEIEEITGTMNRDASKVYNIMILIQMAI